jgi:hypothetical protein
VTLVRRHQQKQQQHPVFNSFCKTCNLHAHTQQQSVVSSSHCVTMPNLSTLCRCEVGCWQWQGWHHRLQPSGHWGSMVTQLPQPVSVKPLALLTCMMYEK